MSLGISIGNEFLDLPPGAILEMDMNNPFLQFGDEILGEFSLPLEVLPTGKNLRLLQWAAIMEQRVTNLGIDAVAHDNGIPSLRGKIKIERPTINLNRTSEGRISIYFLSGISSFYQDVKDKRMRDIDVGGNRSFAWDDFADTGPGFWGHIKDNMVATPGYGVSGYDYAFFPVINKAWPGIEATAEIMNYVVVDGGSFAVSSTVPDNNEPNRIVPFPYLKYVIQQAAAFGGWKISGDILDDEDFIKATMINFRAINWSYIKTAGGSLTVVANDPVEFNLQYNLPDITISKFFIALKNRFGWRYDFDRATKTIFIHELKEIATTVPKDYTTKSNPIVPKPINQDTKIYALRNSFNPDISSGEPNFTVVAYKGTVDELTDLPAAGEDKYAFVYLVVAENNFYICQQNPDTEVWSWIYYAANVYDVKPAGYTDEITTEATTIGNEYYSAYLDFIPRSDLHGLWFGFTDEDADWGIILCYYHGLQPNKADQDYPYGSSGVYNSKFEQVAEWSLAFECKLAGGVVDVGLYERNWKKLLNLLKGQEAGEVKLYLPRHEFVNLSFADILVIRNVKFLIKNMKPTIPYNGEVNVPVLRI